MQLEHRTAKTVEPGNPFPLGATLTENGVNFAIYSKHAAEVFLLLFDSPEGDPTDIIRLGEKHKFIWHAHVPGLAAGQLYGYKVRGEYRPEWGLRFNEAKLLLDPYARAVTGKFRNTDNLLLAYDPQPAGGEFVLDRRDNTRIVPKGVVVDARFDWEGVRAPDLALEQLVIYEVHVKGFTAHPSSGVEFPGTYLGFIEKIPHLARLGVNAVELLPVHEYYVDDFLVERNLTNYWGYNSIGFFSPEWSYSTRRTPGCQVNEFRTLVKELHRAGIKVILDVVYNHSGEGNEMGPTMSFRGIDNLAYYSLTGPEEAPKRYYMNYTGCGNSLNFDSPAVIRLVMDSLRYWVDVMHVDGFRFDLASVLGRTQDGAFRSSASFFDAASQDPVLNRAMLIAEPWDIGTYQVGNFPVDWSEWNGRFRDTMRRFAKGDSGQLADMGWRLTGSADLYGEDGRSAFNSINFVTCHDGFTLADLVSYDRKHNEGNGEDNRDGTNDNLSWNCGVEGDTADPSVLALRTQLMKNHACHLLFASGTPMILGGDEFARSQRGNNNAYCQDNEISWFDWTAVPRHDDLFEFFRRAIAFTRRFPVLQRRKFLLGRDLDSDGVPDLDWFSPDGGGEPAWGDGEERTLCFQLDSSEEGGRQQVQRLFFILNGHFGPRHVRLPPLNAPLAWYRAIDTSLPAGADFADAGQEVRVDPGSHYDANPRSTVVLLAR
jgi:glycogen operon protein